MTSRSANGLEPRPATFDELTVPHAHSPAEVKTLRATPRHPGSHPVLRTYYDQSG